MDDARTRGLDVEIVERPAANSLEEAAAGLGLDPSAIVKTLVVKRHDGDFIFALVPGDRQISWAKLRALVGVNKLSLPHQDVALAATGYERGTITPLGSTTAWPVFADERIVGHRVALGAGEHGLSAFVDADALLKTFGATVADITDELKPRPPDSPAVRPAVGPTPAPELVKGPAPHPEPVEGPPPRTRRRAHAHPRSLHSPCAGRVALARNEQRVSRPPTLVP